MSTFESLEEKIQNMNDEKIIKTKKSPIQAILVTLSGIVLLILGVTVISNDMLTLLLSAIGVAIIILGIVLIILNTGKNAVDYVYEPTGKKMKKYKVYLNEQDTHLMISCINNNDFKKISQLKKNLSTGHMLECLGTDDAQIFIIQLMEYIPHNYVPSSPVIILRGDDANAMLELVKS